VSSPRATSTDSFDLVVVGGGTAGLVAARTAASLGASVAMIERDAAPGGDCLWTGCVPSKTFRAAAATVAQARRAAAYGVELVPGPVDFAAVMAEVRRAVETIAPVDSVEATAAAGVAVVTGTGRFTGPDEVAVTAVDGSVRRLRFGRAVLAMGAGPDVPPLPGLAERGYLTSDDVWELTELPARLLVVGGGVTGCELAQAFARLGSRVTVVEPGGRLLGEEDPDASALVEAALTADGVEVRTGRRVEALAGTAARLDDGTRVAADQVLVATGRRARTADLGLGAVGVALQANGDVVVDPWLRTTNPRIWAAGDLTGYPRYTHLAGLHGAAVAAHAVLGLRRRAAVVPAPRVTYTDPEVAAVGLSAAEGRAAGHRVVTLEHAHVDRAVTEGRTDGFTRLVLDRRGRLLGAVVVSPRAGETIAEATLAINQGVTVATLTASTHPYPGFSDGLWNAAIGEYQRSLGRLPTRTAIGVLRRLRRRHRPGAALPAD
jgi:pyruvate/2-oxoglutarate dehydrogenase complex dihydrolipoamide dehydrogenase (E3) component